MKPIVIIADDLTGACDTGVKFHNAGLRTRVLTDIPTANFACAEDISVISINMNSRVISAERAKQTTCSVLEMLQEKGDFYLYKKVDSVLRGNIMAEIEGVFHALSPNYVIVTPSFPETERRIRDGVLHIQTPQGQKDAVDALALLQSQTSRKCALIGLKVVRRGPKAVISCARELFEGGATVLLADAWEQSDLDILAEAVLALGTRCVPVGSAGLAQSIAEKFPIKKPMAQKQKDPIQGGALIVVGTRHPTTLHQLRQLKKYADLKTYVIPANGVTQDNLMDVLEKALSNPLNPTGRAGILLTTDGIYNGAESSETSLLRNEYNPLILEALGRSVLRLSHSQNIAGIIATGGDVAMEVLKRMNLQWIDLMTEPIPGIVAGYAGGALEKNLLITTKSGGFGGEDALVKMLQYISADKQAI